MQKFIQASKIKGKVNAPASKSMMQRAIAAGLLACGTTVLRNPTFCEDALAALRIAQNLGADILEYKNEVFIAGGKRISTNKIDCGESGLSIRMFAPIAASYDLPIQLHAQASLKLRPVGMLENPLRELGATCSTKSGFPPILIKGRLKGGKAHIDASVSSQVLTGLLMALPKAENDSELIVSNLKSKPYIDMTMSLLENFNIEVENQNYELFKIKGKQVFEPCVYSVEGDWSNAAFLLLAGAIGGEVVVEKIQNNSTQADRMIMKVLEMVGAKTKTYENKIIVSKNELNSFRFDATDSPDLFPPLVALAANCRGKSVIKGAGRLLHKESNRAETLQKEFGKMGIRIEIENDEMIVEGGEIKGGNVDSHKDHRIAMACAVAAINAKKQIIIHGAECVNKSYPEFYDDMKKIGLKLS